MSLETYWLVAPLAIIGLSAFGWVGLWLTRPRKQKDHAKDVQGSLNLTG